MEQFIVVMKQGTGWTSNVGENAPRSYELCESDIQALEELGGEWEGSEFKVIGVDEDGTPVGRIEFVG